MHIIKQGYIFSEILPSPSGSREQWKNKIRNLEFYQSFGLFQGANQHVI